MTHIIIFGFVLWHINPCGLSIAKAIFRVKQYWYYLTYGWEDKEVHTFPKGIYPKVNLTAW